MDKISSSLIFDDESRLFILMVRGGKTVLKSYVNGLVSPQKMVFLDIEISFQKMFCGYVQSRIKPRINQKKLKIFLRDS